MDTIRIDGLTYHVRIKFDSLNRGFSFVEGQNGGRALSGREILDTIGTMYTYEMSVEPDPNYRAEYDSFYQVVTSPVRVHTVTLPDGQDFITFDCKITGGKDVYAGKMGGFNRWHGLKVQFIPIEPQRRPT